MEYINGEFTEREALALYANGVGMSDAVRIEQLDGSIYKLVDTRGVLELIKKVSIKLVGGGDGEQWLIKDIESIVVSKEVTTKMPKDKRLQAQMMLTIWNEYKWFDDVAVRPAGGSDKELIVSLLRFNYEGSRIFPIPELTEKVKSVLDGLVDHEIFSR